MACRHSVTLITRGALAVTLGAVPTNQWANGRHHAVGFRDVVVTSSPRPVQCTAVEWYRTFGKVFLESVPVADRAAFLDDYRTACAHRLGGENRLDFVRLRWRAVRRGDRSR